MPYISFELTEDEEFFYHRAIHPDPPTRSNQVRWALRLADAEKLAAKRGWVTRFHIGTEELVLYDSAGDTLAAHFGLDSVPVGTDRRIMDAELALEALNSG